MSLESPAYASPLATDPFELDRLAHELELRESIRTDGDQQQHELPAYVPLSHDNPHLSAKSFNVQEFLLSRSYSSLPDLRTELRDYLAKLKEELVQLINDEYEAFISLSTDLKDEGDRLQRIREPLGSLRAQIQSAKDQLRSVHDAIQDKLAKRAILREEKALLQLLLKISESVSRIESLLLIPSPDEDKPNLLEITGSTPISNLGPNESVDGKSSTSRVKYLARVAAEYTQLLYRATKARDEKCAFVDTVQWRIDRIRSTLSSDLDQVWASTLTAFTEGKTTEIEKSKLLTDMTDCLRTYDALELWRDAEDVIRAEVARKFVKKTVYSDALVVPHSPIVPHTPFPAQASFASASLPTSLPLRTPYTPFTAFVFKQSQFTGHLSDRPSGSPYESILRDDYPLARLFSQMLRFVERDLGRIMEIAEKVSLRSRTGQGNGNHSGSNEKRFEILANVIWDEFGQAIMDELGSFAFSVGRPNEFRKHYELSYAFVRCLEYLAPSAGAVEAMRRHPTYEKFQKRWQLPVYFQLRWKEIVGKLEESLSVTSLDTSSTKIIAPFATAQATAVWVAISACWSAEIYIPDLCHRFWRLTLQILSRHKTWLDSAIHLPEPLPAVDKILTSPAVSSRSATPLPPSDPPAPEVVAAEDGALQRYGTAIVDIKSMNSAVMTLWRQDISMMLPDTGNDDNAIADLEDALRRSLSSLVGLIPPLSKQIIQILEKRCCEALLPVRSVPAQFRAMANKRTPIEPSYFVSSILRPVKVFFAGENVGTSLKDEFLKEYLQIIFDSVTQKYIHHLTTMKKTEESLKRLKKGKKTAFSMFGNASTVDESRDEERIRTQTIIDVETFGQDARSLGIEPEKHDSYKVLKELVHAVDEV
ncbi:COG (conserved oligomeric Golgi) complex component, COG2 domain containing protein [Amanita muscaria]